MRKPYSHLCEVERNVIYRMNKAGNTQPEIAKAIGRPQGSISRELSRNKGKKGYRPKQAHEKAQERKWSKRSKPLLIVGDLEKLVIEKLLILHSPEQISGRLAQEGIQLGTETIYRFIFENKRNGGELHKGLRINGRRRYRRRVKDQRKGKIKNRRGIEHRPKVVEERKRYGDWEVDLIEGSKGTGFLLSLYERKSRFAKLVYLESKGAQGTAEAIIEALKNYRVLTLTYDNGLEFANHEQVSKALEAEAYFCNPYHSWEKGGVENYNGLVRQYFPKGSSFLEISVSALARAETEINERPKKILDFKSPSELEYQLAA